MSLEQDYTTVPGQLFACLSVVGPEAPQKNDQFGIKIRGAFATRDEAANHAKRLQKEDATFDIYVVDMYKWLLIPPDPTKIEDVHYTNEKLEEIMSGYKENQAQAARMFQERKSAMMAAKDYISPGDENSKFYTKPDEPPIPHPAEVLERLQKEKPDTPMEDLVKEADALVAAEIEERRKLRESEIEAESSTEAKIEESKEEGEPEVSSA
jgi:protease II